MQPNGAVETRHLEQERAVRGEGTHGPGEVRDVLEHSSRSVIRCCVGIPLKGHTPPDSYHNRMVMFQNLGFLEAKGKFLNEPVRFEFEFCAIGEVFIPFAREFICNHALETNCDYVFMVDDDMMVDPQIFFKLQENDKDICTALAFTRNPTHLPVAYQMVEGWDPVSRKEFARSEHILNYPKNQLVRLDASGFGVVLIKTEVLKKMQKPWFMGSHGTGEDLHFCLEARKYGFETWMDTRLKTGHLSNNIVVTEEYANNYRKLDQKEADRLYGNYEKYANVELAK